MFGVEPFASWGNWLHGVWFGYFLPSLLGNGPEALVQTIVYGAIALIFIPPVRRWMARHVDSIKAHITAEHDAVHEKLDHIIHHTKAIPNQRTDGSDWKERPQA